MQETAVIHPGQLIGSRHLTATDDAPAQARLWLRGLLGDAPAEVVGDATLLISELVTNAVLHAAPPIEVRLYRAQNLVTVAVSDGSAEPGVVHAARPSDEGGRGLLLVERIAARWGTDVATDRKTTWAELEAEPGRSA